jgi:hypothetical protein
MRSRQPKSQLTRPQDVKVPGPLSIATNLAFTRKLIFTNNVTKYYILFTSHVSINYEKKKLLCYGSVVASVRIQIWVRIKKAKYMRIRILVRLCCH